MTTDPQPTAPPPDDSLLDRLQHRGVTKAAGLYVGAATSAILFTDFITKHFGLSPHLTEIVMVTALAALPSALLIAWRRGGTPGTRRLKRPHQLAVGTNGVLALALLGVGFAGKPLGPVTHPVTTEGADGETIERVVASDAYRTRVIVSDFTGDPALGRAAGYALAVDLDQDLFVRAGPASSLRRSLRQAGFQTAAEAPTALLLDGARTLQSDWLLTGRVAPTAEGVRVEASLHDPGRPGSPETFRSEGPDFARALDEVSARVRGALSLPEIRRVGDQDRLIEDHLTSSQDALVAWAAGIHAHQFEDDPDAAIAHYEAAVALDSTFARANLIRGSTLAGLQRTAHALGALGAAQRHRYRLPEAVRYSLDASVAYHEQRPDDALAIVRDWAALYPDDAEALDYLLWFHQTRDEPEEAIGLAQTLVDIDPGNPLRLFNLARLYLIEDRLDEAETTTAAYVAAAPEDPGGPSLLAGVRMYQGDLDGAIEAARHAARLAPSDLRHTQVVAQYLTRTGAWDEATAIYERVGATAAEPTDRAQALSGLAHLYDYRGQYAAAADVLDRRWALLEPVVPTVDLLRGKVGEGYHYTRAGRTEAFEVALAAALARPEVAASGTYRADLASAAAWAYAQTGRSAEVFAYAATADSLNRAYGREATLPYVNAVRGMGHANRGDHRRAIAAMAPYAEDTPADTYRVFPLALAYADAGDTDAARRVAEAVVETFPAHPGARLLLARLDASRRPEAAREHLAVALDTWADADAGLPEVAQARRLAARLGMGRRGT